MVSVFRSILGRIAMVIDAMQGRWEMKRDGEAEYSVHTRRCRNWESYAL